MAITAKKLKAKRALFARRKKKVNSKIKEQSFDIRILVQKSNKSITAQAIDATGNIVGHITDAKATGETKTQRATSAGKILGETVAKLGGKCVFDRNGNLYHGRVKAFADGLREGGIAI